MGEAALVGQDIDDGARLIQEIDASRFPVSAAFWAHDPSLDVWRLVIAIPVREVPSPKTAYSRIQATITRLDLALPLDRITLISDKDPQIGSLRELIRSGSSAVVEIPIHRAEIAGELVDRGYGYRIEALHYRAEVFSALERNQPEDAVLRRVGWLDPPSGQDLDFTLDNGEILVFVETKALSRPLSRKDIDRSSDLRRRMLTDFRRQSVWLIISQTGFTSNTVGSRSDLPTPANPMMRIMLTRWSSRDDDPQLRETLSAAFRRS